MHPAAEAQTPSSSSVRGGLKSKWRGPSYPPDSEDVDGPEGAAHVPGAEPQVLVEARAGLAVEVDVEELAVPQRLGQAVGEVQAGHLLVPDLGVHAHQLGVLELVDERECVADRGQQDVAARLVGLRLDGEADVVALLEHVLRRGR